MSHRGSFEVLVPLFSLKVSLLGLIGSKGLTRNLMGSEESYGVLEGT